MIVGIYSKVVQQVVGRFVSGLGGPGLFRADGDESGEELIVDCSGMV